MILKIIRYLFFTLFFAVPLVMFSGTSELFEFNKMILIYILSIVIVTLYLIHHILNRYRTLNIPFLIVIYLIFLATQVLSTIFSIDMHTSLFGYYGRFNGGLLSIIAYLSLFFVFVNVFDRASAMKLLKISFYSSIVVILWGLPGRFGHDLSCLLFTGQFSNNCWTDQFHPAERLFSTLGQPNWLGAYLVIQFFIGLYFWLKEMIKQSKFKLTAPIIFYSLYLIVNFTALLFTRSRSSLAALIAMLVVFPVIYYFSSKRQEFMPLFKKYCLLLALFLVPIIIFKTGVVTIDRFLTLPQAKKVTPASKTAVIPTTSTTSTSSEPTESFDIRKIVWQGAIDLGFQYPFFGTGVETFAYSYYFTRPQAHNLTSEWDFLYNKAHNEYLNYFATTGALGISAYLVLIGYIVVIFYRKIIRSVDESDKLLALCLLLSFFSILITNFFGFSTTNINLFFYLLPGFIYVYYREKPVEADGASFSALTLHKKIQMIVVTAVGAWLLLSTIRYYIADIEYAQADTLTHAGQYGQAAVNLQSALSFHNEHVYKDKLSYTLANLAFVAAYQKEATGSAQTKPQTTADTYVELAKYFNTQSLRESPKNILYYKTTSKNDYLFYQIYLDPKYLIDALQAMTQAKVLSPTDPKLPYTSALFYSLLVDESKIDKAQVEMYQTRSLEAIDQSIALKPDYRDAYFLKGQLLKKYGRNQEAQQIFQYILKSFDPNDQEVLKELTK